MNKVKFFILFLLFSHNVYALNVSDADMKNILNTKFFKNYAVSVIYNQNNELNSRYKILISTIKIVDNPEKNIFFKIANPTIQQVGDPIWLITSDQIPVTENNCIDNDIDTCIEGDNTCYKYCLTDMEPIIYALDENSKVLKFQMGTISIGTIGGPAFMFAADINTKQIKYDSLGNYDE